MQIYKLKADIYSRKYRFTGKSLLLLGIAPVTFGEAPSHLCGIRPETLICWCCKYRSSECLVEKYG